MRWLLLLVVLLVPFSARAQGRAGGETEEERIFAEAEALFNAGRYGDAAPLYDRALALNPTRPATLVKRATLYFRERRYDKAIELLRRAQALAPEDLNLQTVLGLCLYRSGRQPEGLAVLGGVAARRPEAYEAQLQIGQHYARLDPERAIAALDLYFRYRPADEGQRALDGPAHLSLGTAYFLKGRLPEAERALQAAFTERPRDVQARLTLGAVELAEGKYAQAAALHEPLMDDVPRRPRVAYNLAQAYLHLGRRAEAARLAERYAALQPQDPRAQVLLGDVAMGGREADTRGALRHYEEAARLSQRPGVEPAAVSLEARKAWVYLSGRDPGRAIAFAETALSRAPEGQGLRPGEEEDLIAVLLEAELAQLEPGSPARPELIKLATRLAQLAPNDATALALCGSTALATGNLERARKFYGDALALDPKLRRARAGMARALQRLALAQLGGGESGGAKSDLKDWPEGLTQAIGLLELALPYDEGTGTARNLAVVYLMAARPQDAERVLGPALAGPGRGDLVLQRLRARALLAEGKGGPALELYERIAAEAAQQPAQAGLLAEVHVELGGRYLAAGKLDEAVEVLERARGELAGRGEEAEGARKAAQRDLSLAYLARGRARLQEQEAALAQSIAAPLRQAEAAVEDLKRALERGGLQAGRRETGAALCLAALAASQAGRYHDARELIGKARDEGGCDFVAPYDRLGLDLLSAYIGYRDTASPAQRERALRVLSKLQGRVGSGAAVAPLANLLRSLLRSLDEALAYDYYATSKNGKAAQLLRAAQKVPVAGPGDGQGEGDPVLAHNLAVLELQEGRAGAERVLERQNGRPPEGLVNLGLLRERRGEPKKALELYRKALERGARTPRLREWIDVKERMLGEGT